MSEKQVKELVEMFSKLSHQSMYELIVDMSKSELTSSFKEMLIDEKCDYEFWKEELDSMIQKEEQGE